MRYQSKPTECEAMGWWEGDQHRAEAIVDWVNANGGEAQYEPEYIDHNGPQTPARIAVRTINGWAYAAPGHYVVKGTAWFDSARTGWGDQHPWETLDFYPCDPETFEKRWGPTP